MSDVQQSTTEVSSKREVTGWKKWVLIASTLFAVYTFIGYSEQKKAHISTLQSIIDKDNDTKSLKVTSVRFPIYVAFPLSDYLAEFGVVPGKYSEYFTVEHKNGSALQGNCEFETYDYSVRKGPSNKSYFSIEGAVVEKLMSCS